ncbi:MAG TPA: S1C family serine protease [Candidatus Latescibacteria bacterium]|nr:S1C family serine protease [Candidatus Latescibacterota bacterium]
MPNRVLKLVAALTVAVSADHAGSTVLQDMEREVSGIASRVASRVVTVQASFRNPNDENAPGIVNVGTGLLLDSLGHVITASSVLSGMRVATPVMTVIDNGDRTHEALLYDVDSTLRIAVLYVPTMEAGSPIHAKRADWAPGYFALVVGNSFGVGPAVRMTTVSGQRARDGFWQLSDPATPGFSGAPVFDSRGAFGGIIVGEVAGQAREPRPSPAVMVTARQLAPVMSRIAALSGNNNRSWLGLSVRPFVQTDGGTALVVSNVIGGSPAAQAGFLPGDVVTRVDTVDVNFVSDLADWVRRSRPGYQATVRIVRQGVEQDIRVTVGSR